MIKRFLPWLVLLLAIVVFMALRMTRPELVQAEAQERAWLVAVQSAELIDATPLLPLYGQVVAPHQLTVTAALPGQIAQRPVSEGQAVAAGTLLVALDDADVAPALARAQADVADLQAQIEAEQLRHGNDQRALESEQSILASAQRQLERNQSLLKRNLTSREALDDVADAYARAELTVSTRQRALGQHPARLASLQARLANAQANLQGIKRDAGRARVIAPFDGVITDVQVAAGDRVSKNQALLSLYPRLGLELRARVPGVFVAELQQALNRGKKLQASTDDGRYRFTLQRFAGTGSAAGTEAILVADGSADGLRPGSLLPVTLQRPPQQQVVSVPFSALYGADTLYVVGEDFRLQRLRVERVGEARAGAARNLLVRGDELQPGLRIITTHLPNAMSGLKVDIAGVQSE